MVRIVETHHGSNGDVRNVTLKTSTNKVLQRPINKIVLLLGEDE